MRLDLVFRFAMEVPGTKTTSQYRGVSRNKAIGQWMAVVWNFQERKTQIVGNYASEIEVSSAHLHVFTSVHSSAPCAGRLTLLSQLAISTMP